MYEPVVIFDPEKKIGLELNRTSYLTAHVQGKSVLHIGCADYPVTEQRIRTDDLLHRHLSDAASYVVGIDNSPQGIELLKQNGFDNVILMDAERLDLGSKFDVVLAGDTLEHLSNPGKFLESVGGLLNPDGELIVGVPSAYSFNSMRFLLMKSEPTHKDHTFFYSPKTLIELCSRYSLLPAKLVFTAQPRDPYESKLFIFCRNTLISIFPKMAPSFIMHFKPREQVNTNESFLWK